MGYSPLPWRRLATAASTCALFYFSLLGLLILSPSLQAHVFYLHRAGPSFLWDASVPEQFGFLPRQVSPFYLNTADGETLHAWHVLPLQAYLNHKDALLMPSSGSKDNTILGQEFGMSNTTNMGQDLVSSPSLRILQEDPEAYLVVYFHGVAGNMASGWRPGSYRALSSAAPDKIHILAFDYRGYGRSTGFPSEEGLLQDAIAAVNWALEVAGIPPERIVIYGQSLGTAVAVSVSQRFAVQSPPVMFAGQVLTAPFSDVETLPATYRIGGVIPVMSPIAGFPRLFKWFNSFLTNTWRSGDRLADIVRIGESGLTRPYHITLIHAEDDITISCEHSNVLYWRMTTTARDQKQTYESFQDRKPDYINSLGQGGWTAEHRTSRGIIRQEMLRYGVHNKIMSYPVGGAAVLRTIQSAKLR